MNNLKSLTLVGMDREIKLNCVLSLKNLEHLHLTSFKIIFDAKKLIFSKLKSIFLFDTDLIDF